MLVCAVAEMFVCATFVVLMCVAVAIFTCATVVILMLVAVTIFTHATFVILTFVAVAIFMFFDSEPVTAYEYTDAFLTKATLSNLMGGF